MFRNRTVNVAPMPEANTPDRIDGTSSSGPTSGFPRDIPLVFISHDTRDADLAEAFSRLLGSVSAGVLKSFRSSDRRGGQGIEYGVEWFPEIMEKLSRSSDVVCLLTPRSVDRPWILYEAGVAKGKLDSPVLGLVLGASFQIASTGPFAQFQNTDDDVDSITALVMQLLRRIPNAEPDREAVANQVRLFKERADEILARLEHDPVTTEEMAPDGSGETAARLFEEVKVMFKDLPSRLEDRISRAISSPASRKDSLYLHRDVFGAAARLKDVFPKKHWGWLYLINSFREECPWLYEQGMEVYRAATAIPLSYRSVRPHTSMTRMTRLRVVLRNVKEFNKLVEFTLDLERDSHSTLESTHWLGELPYFTEWYFRELIDEERENRTKSSQTSDPDVKPGK